jgi:hypothetical protein
MRHQDGMSAIVAAVDALACDPYPPETFHAREYNRLRVGQYRVFYRVHGDVVTIERVDRIILRTALTHQLRWLACPDRWALRGCNRPARTCRGPWSSLNRSGLPRPELLMRCGQH